MTNEINNLVQFGLNIKNAIQLSCLLNLPPRNGRMLLVTDSLPAQRKVQRVLESKGLAYDVFTNDRLNLLADGEAILLVSSNQMLMGVDLSNFACGAFLEEGQSSKRADLVRGKIKNAILARNANEVQPLVRCHRSRRLTRKLRANRKGGHNG